MKINESEIKARIFRKLARINIWGEKHTSFDNLQKSFPSHLKGCVKKIAEKLIREEYIISKPTTYGLEVSLNPKKSDEIYKIIREFFTDGFL